MRSFRATALELTAVAVTAWVLGGCASTAPSESPRVAGRNAVGQSELQGMEDSVLEDDDSDTPVRAKPPI